MCINLSVVQPLLCLNKCPKTENVISLMGRLGGILPLSLLGRSCCGVLLLRMRVGGLVPFSTLPFRDHKQMELSPSPPFTGAPRMGPHTYPTLMIYDYWKVMNNAFIFFILMVKLQPGPSPLPPCQLTGHVEKVTDGMRTQVKF